MTWPPGAVFSEILPLAKDFDQAAIGMLYRRFLPAVYRYILARVADVATAEDLTSETFLAMIRGITSTRATDELGYAAWLLGIARNQVLMHFRRHKIRPEVELLPQYIDRSQTVAEEDDPMLVLMARETWNETAEALEKLTEEQKTVIIYRCVLGYSTDEVAEMMNKRPGTVRVIQFRALSALTRHLNARPAEASSATKSANEPEAPEKRRQYGG
jgi:RNA polymerase sigma-70 factor, ECF subfamily